MALDTQKMEKDLRDRRTVKKTRTLNYKIPPALLFPKGGILPLFGGSVRPTVGKEGEGRFAEYVHSIICLSEEVV